MNTTLEKDKVSVIIPTYNRAHFISNAVNSVISQNYNNLEIIIVDDGSDDNTEEVVTSLKLKYPEIIYCHNDRSKGPSGARNTGMLRSSGNYLSFLDSDDIWLDNHLSTGLEILNNNPEIDVFFANFSVVDFQTGKHQYDFFDKKTILHTLKSVQIAPGVKILQDDLLLPLVQEGFFHLGGTILKKSVTNGIMFDESIMFTEDRDFAIRLNRETDATFAFSKDPSFVLYTHSSNLYNNSDSIKWQKTIETHSYLFTKYLRNYHLSNNEKKVLRKIIFKLYLNLSYLYAKNKNIKNVFSYFFKSIKYSLSYLER